MTSNTDAVIRSKGSHSLLVWLRSLSSNFRFDSSWQLLNGSNIEEIVILYLELKVFTLYLHFTYNFNYKNLAKAIFKVMSLFSDGCSECFFRLAILKFL